MCQRFGITVPDVERQVFITVPGGVWYYLREEGFYLDTLIARNITCLSS